MKSTSFDIPIALKQLITSNQAFTHRVVPVSKQGNTVVFKSDSDTPKLLEKKVSILLGMPLKIEKDTQVNIQSYLVANYRKASANKARLDEGTFLKQLLQTAQDFNSSDIHIETYDKRCRVRFRLDGKLKEQYTIAASDYQGLINQIKVKANLDIAQKRNPQDGRITERDGNQEFDIRVSTMPTIHGEKIVMRILKQDTEAVELSQLGFNEKELRLYLEGIKMPNGIILISGPTGSGKTTTLYGTMKLLNNEQTNIVTIEDPVEYLMEGINQMQLKEDIGLDFPSALRTFMRQDPDVIMVGEIRDKKTAEMAIRAALTGHLVLSTIHTNSAWATISRLIDMGIAPFLIASTLNTSVAQRLVRKLCNHCKKEAPITEGILPIDFKQKDAIKKHFESVGCEKCYFTGYQGRKAIYEIIPINAALKNHIKNNESQIEMYLAESNLNTLKSNAIALINTGETSIDEVYALLAN